MEITTATFVKSSQKMTGLPAPDMPEYAFVGRSNVGKSSLINSLVGQKSLAKTSSTPGKTQLINHFLINHSWYLVDLPGYGYAQVSKKLRAQLQDIITTYTTQRENLMNLFVLIDCRHKPQEVDLEFMEFLGINEIPFSIVFTKIDKPRQKDLNNNLKYYKKALLEKWEELPHILQTSAVKGLGNKELLGYIESINPLFEK